MGGHGNHLHTWPLLTAEQVQVNTPTQKDGWKASQEIAVRKKAGKVIYDTTIYFAHPMSSGTASVGVTLFLRFYSQKSMVKYHPFVMAVASLFLAGKIDPRLHPPDEAFTVSAGATADAVVTNRRPMFRPKWLPISCTHRARRE